MPLQLLMVGQLARAEAAPLERWISQNLQPADARQYPTLADALVSLEGWMPDLIVIVQSWPDEFTRLEVDQLTRLAPLARWVVGCGSWCESDGRTRDLWPLAVRIPLRSAAARLLREWHLLNGENLSAIPMSASREESFAVDHPGWESVPIPVTVGVDSLDSEYARFLRESLSAAGFKVPTEECDVAECQVVLFDIDPWNDRRQKDLLESVTRFPERRFVGLMNLPSPDETNGLLKLGIAEVLPKLGDWRRIRESAARHGGSE